MFEKYLQDIGLSDKESLVYLALLSVDNDSVVDLSTRTKINRTTIYPVLESLAKKGLISEVKVDKKVRFQAEPPERLETFVTRQKILFEEKAERVKDIIPQLKSVQRESGEKPKVTYFEGREGIISSLENFFENGKNEDLMYMIYSRDLVEEVFTDSEIKRFSDWRQQKGIRVKSIYTHKSGELQKNKNSTRIIIDGDKYPIKTDISIIGDMVKVSVLESNLSGILIRSKDFAETLKSLINYFFDNQK